MAAGFDSPEALAQELPSIAIDEVFRARKAASRLDWQEAYEMLSRVDRRSGLKVEDLELLATSAFLTGHREESRRARTRAYHTYLHRGEYRWAARCAVKIGLEQISTSEITQAAGCLPASMSGCTAWIDRASTHLAGEGEGAEHGFLLIPEAYEQLAIGGDFESAARSAARAAGIGRDHDEPDLVAFALTIEGRALARSGRVAEGMGRLREATTEVASGRVSPATAGVVLASAVEAADEVFDVEQLDEWVDMLSAWCDAQKGMVTFRTRAMVYRALLCHLHGRWDEALGLATRATERAITEADPALAGAAVYQQAEVHRLRGESAASEEAYRKAVRMGHDPQPGLALLRMMGGEVANAIALLDRAIAECRHSLRLARLLPAQVEIILQAGDIPAAATAGAKLAEIAASYGGAVLEATAAQAQAEVLLAGGEALAALEACRRAGRVWRQLGLPFEEARSRMLVARACRALDDDITATMELEATRSILARLGARPFLAEVGTILGRDHGSDHGLTRRELEVLQLLATGVTNGKIAKELVVSVRTVETHVSNILSKLGVSSRSAATSYAHRHGLA